MSDPSTRQVELIDLDEIRPADRNPKTHEHALLRLSFERFGFVEPIVRDDRTGRLVAGHGRVEQLRQARARRETPPPGVSLTEEGTWRVPVITGWASLDDSEAQAYVIASNRTVEAGGWDETILADVIVDLDAQLGDHALDGLGYDLDDALAILSRQLGADLDDEHEARPVLEGLRYRVIVDCDDEAAQAHALEELQVLGYSVRAVVN